MIKSNTCQSFVVLLNIGMCIGGLNFVMRHSLFTID